MSDVRIRPMTVEDLAAVEDISAEAFLDVDVRRGRREDEQPRRRAPERAERWIARTRRLLAGDPDGCWVADDGDPVGFAVSVRRGDLWVLPTLAVRPGHQGRGIGARLLDRALDYGRGSPVGLLAASDEPMALRRYWSAGFVLHPQLRLRGAVRRDRIPRVSGVRAGTADDVDWMDDLVRRRRGGPLGADHESLAAMTDGGLLVASSRTGYAYATPQETFQVAAEDEATAVRLLWECLARADGDFTVSHVTTANRWAVDVAMTAGLALDTQGHLAVRGMAPPDLYVHNGALL